MIENDLQKILRIIIFLLDLLFQTKILLIDAENQMRSGASSADVNYPTRLILILYRVMTVTQESTTFFSTFMSFCPLYLSRLNIKMVRLL